MNALPFIVKIVEVTPEVAKQFMQMNVRNYRPLDNAHVTRLSEMMTKKQFRENGDPIRISKSGVVLDGQHRLQAIIKTGTTHRMVVFFDCDETKMDVSLFDTGKRRVGATHLAANGFANAKDVWAASKKCLIIKSGKWGAEGNLPDHMITDAAVFDFAFENKDSISSAVLLARKTTKIVPASIMAAVLWYGTFGNDVEKCQHAQGFISQLKEGAGLAAGSPIFCLRKAILEKKRHEVISAYMMRCWVTVAWNCSVKNKSIHRFVSRECPSEILVAKG